MKRLIFLFLLTFLLSPSFTHAQNCDRGNTRNTTYMLRQRDKRCEGINSRQFASTSFGLNSFTIGQLKLNDSLVLQIPKIPNSDEPKVRVQSLEKYYQLDPLELNEDENGQNWQFRWSSQVLRQENISPQTLRSLASVNDIIIPVRFNSSSAPNYNIGIYTGGNTLEITLRIETTNGQEVYKERLVNQLGEEVDFTWNGKTQTNQTLPQGRYVLKINATVEQENAPARKRFVTREFEHNPQWLN